MGNYIILNETTRNRIKIKIMEEMNNEWDEVEMEIISEITKECPLFNDEESIRKMRGFYQKEVLNIK